MKFAAITLLSTILLATACSSDFEPGSRVTKLRLLAVAADAPYALAEETVTLTPLLAAPDSVPVSWAYATCTDPRASTIDACLAQLDEPFELFDPERRALSLQLKSADAYAHSGFVGVVIVACPGVLSEGATEHVPITCRSLAGEVLGLGQFEVGMKRIFVRGSDRNPNPSITVVSWDGEAWPEAEIKQAEACDKHDGDISECPSGLSHHLGFVTSAPDQGRDEHGQDFHEQQVVQVYATHGAFEYEVRVAEAADNAWVAQRRSDSGAPDDIATLWFVVRDDRGGVGWQRRQVRVR